MSDAVEVRPETTVYACAVEHRKRKWMSVHEGRRRRYAAAVAVADIEGCIDVKTFRLKFK